VDIQARGGAAAASGIIMSKMIREDLGEGKVMNRKGVGSEESVPLSEKDDESPFFLVVSCIGPLLDRALRSCLEQAFLDGCSSILDSV
jgi:hypothetical protein